MNFTGGNKALVDAEARAKAILAAAPTVASYTSERAAADKELAALAAHAAAGPGRARSSRRSASCCRTRPPRSAWPRTTPRPGRTALTAVQRARADLAEAKKVADDLGPTVAAQAAAAKPNDVAGMKTALAQLRTDAAAAGKLPFAAEAGGAVQELHRRRRQGRQGARQERRQGRGEGAGRGGRRRSPQPRRCSRATASTR